MIEEENKEHNESKGYRLLFEFIERYGIEQILNFFKELNDYTYLNAKIIDRLCNNSNLPESNKSLVKYLILHKKDLERIYIKSLKQFVHDLKCNPHIITTYIENARKLERLKISEIDLVSESSLLKRTYYCSYYKDKGKLTSLYKSYTDGTIVTRDRVITSSQGTVKFKIEKEPTFLLNCDIRNNHWLPYFRHIQITSFDFNSKYLPTEEELNSHDIPSILKLTK